MRLLFVVFALIVGVLSAIVPVGPPPSPHTWTTWVDTPCSEREAQWLAYLKQIDGYREYGVTVKYEDGSADKLLSAEELALA